MINIDMMKVRVLNGPYLMLSQKMATKSVFRTDSKFYFRTREKTLLDRDFRKEIPEYLPGVAVLLTLFGMDEL